ncbi:unnamed protein product, partial [Vitis vinifera]
MLEAKSLRKAVVAPSLLENPSAANLQSTRLALHVDGGGSSCRVYIASGCSIYSVQISMEDSLVNKGKESLLIPVSAQVMDSSLVNRCPHRSEIQSIVLAETESPDCLILGSVDSYGHLIVSQLDPSSKDVNRVTLSVLPRDCGVGEGSWAGLCFSPSQWSMAAVARSFCKSIDVYDQDIHLRTLRTLWYPSSLDFMQNLSNGNERSILAVTEGCQLTIWDLRMKENGGCVHRICGPLGDIFYAVTSSSTGSIAVGGADRTVTIYDPRRWSALSRWVHCSKYEITGLAFSSSDPDYIYIQGVDYEVFCGQWNENKKVFSFRGDSNWLGFSKCPNRDVLGGWCDSGSIFVADVEAKENKGTHEVTGLEVELEAFQRQVADRFLQVSSGSSELLSLSWVRKLLDVFLCCQEEFRVILFNNKATSGDCAVRFRQPEESRGGPIPPRQEGLDRFGDRVSRSWSAARQLQAIGNNLAAPRANEIVASRGLAVAVFTMSSVFWAAPMQSLHDRIIEESRRRDRRNACGLLKEIHQIEKCTRHMNELADSVQFPLTEEREAEVRQRVQELGQVCQTIKAGLDPLERQVREVFHRIVRSRTEGLDTLGRANNEKTERKMR